MRVNRRRRARGEGNLGFRRLNTRFGFLQKSVQHPQPFCDLGDIYDSPGIPSVTHCDLHHTGAQTSEWLCNIRLAAFRGDRQRRVDTVPDSLREAFIRFSNA